MVSRVVRCFVLTTLLAAGNLAAARAEPLPAPKEQLKDYNGRGIIQVELSPTDPVVAKEGDKKVLNPGVVTWFPFRQAYVHPDTVMMELGIASQQGIAQVTLVTGNMERSFAPGQGLIVTRVYKNLDTAPVNPIPTLQLAMSTYAKLFRELDSGKLLPDEDLDALEKKETARIAELAALRAELKKSTNPDDIARAAAAASESARLRDDITQLAIRRAHPCYQVEFPNKDLVKTLFSRGLAGGADFAQLNEGRTRAWITRAEGLPVKIETTANDGHVAIFVAFTQLQVNTGLRSRELSLNTPPGVKEIMATADVRKQDWEEKMEEEITTQIQKFTEDRRKSQQPQVAQPVEVVPEKSKKKKK